MSETRDVSNISNVTEKFPYRFAPDRGGRLHFEESFEDFTGFNVDGSLSKRVEGTREPTLYKRDARSHSIRNKFPRNTKSNKLATEGVRERGGRANLWWDKRARHRAVLFLV